MASKSSVSYAERARNSKNELVQKLFEVAEQKKSNVVVSADLITTKELLYIADGEADRVVSRRSACLSTNNYSPWAVHRCLQNTYRYCDRLRRNHRLGIEENVRETQLPLL